MLEREATKRTALGRKGRFHQAAVTRCSKAAPVNDGFVAYGLAEKARQALRADNRAVLVVDFPGRSLA